jgi:hypothetical protein
MTTDVIERRIAKLRTHLRTRRGRGDFAALELLVKLLHLKDDRDWYQRAYVKGLLKVIYPANSIYPTGVPLRELGHPLLAMLRKG